MRISHTGVLIALAALLAGCTKTEVYSYERVAEARVDAAYIVPGTDFSKYSRVYAKFRPLEIYYEEGDSAPTSVELEQLRAIFRNAFLTAVVPEYQIVYEPAPDALGVRASLIKIQSEKYLDELPMQGNLRSLVAAGELTFLLELSDSVTGEVLARAADRQKPEYAEFEGLKDQDFSEAETAARYCAKLFREFLDRNLGQ